MKLALITDAWHPQINGVVTTLSQTCHELEKTGFSLELITPDRFRTWPCPSYPSIRLALGCGARVRRILRGFKPDHIHIATEGPLGFAARAYCLHRGLAFTTSFHTLFPEYVNLRFHIPIRFGYAWLRRFHAHAFRVMVATATVEKDLVARGFKHLARWSRGVDAHLYQPRPKTFITAPRPVFLYVGRVAVEKSIEDFLRLDLPGSKIVVGDGPQRHALSRSFPQVRFAGFQSGVTLARHIAAADVLVFPSRTDTFGLTILEALACGVPVAAYPVQGPRDVLVEGRTGCMHPDLRTAALNALTLDAATCREYALRHSWETCTQQFVSNLTPPLHDN